jgi:hypothetical protein
MITMATETAATAMTDKDSVCCVSGVEEVEGCGDGSESSDSGSGVDMRPRGCVGLDEVEREGTGNERGIGYAHAGSSMLTLETSKGTIRE